MQQINLNAIRSIVDTVVFSDRSKISDYNNLFYEHLYSLIQYDYVVEQKSRKISKFGLIEYYGLEQFVFDNTLYIEKGTPKQIDWDLLDESRELLKQRIKKLLGKEGSSEFLKPMINFTVDSFENSLMYQMLQPEGKGNPWLYTDGILQTGYLFIATDDRDFIKEYNPRILEKDENSKNIAIVSTSKKNQRKQFNGFVIDNRLSAQSVVYEFLQRTANGYNSAKPKSVILNFLREQNMRVEETILTNSILLPLKRAGIIGSSSTGFFFISSESDLQRSYDFHRFKFKALEKTLTMHEARAASLGYKLY